MIQAIAVLIFILLDYKPRQSRPNAASDGSGVSHAGWFSLLFHFTACIIFIAVCGVCVCASSARAYTVDKTPTPPCGILRGPSVGDVNDTDRWVVSSLMRLSIIIVSSASAQQRPDCWRSLAGKQRTRPQLKRRDFATFSCNFSIF